MVTEIVFWLSLASFLGSLLYYFYIIWQNAETGRYMPPNVDQRLLLPMIIMFVCFFAIFLTVPDYIWLWLETSRLAAVAGGIMLFVILLLCVG
jgi:hypothetical protein